MNDTKIPSPLGAATLSLLVPGLGQLAVGRLRRGLLLLPVPLALAPIAFLSAGLGSGAATVWGFVGPIVVLVAVCVWAAVDAGRAAREDRLLGARPALGPRPFVAGSAILLSGLVVTSTLLWWVREDVYQVFFVPTHSMTPAIESGDRIVVNKRPRTAERGDVVVFTRPDGAAWVKRLVGLPGDVVETRGGRVFVNGEPITSARADDRGLRDELGEGSHHRVRIDETEDIAPVRVAEGHGYVLGDDRRNSRDSRQLGSIRLDDVIGQALLRTWPVSRFGDVRR